MPKTANRPERLAEVWSEDRDVIVAKRLDEDITKLREAGYDDAEIKKMIGTFKYVKFYSANPSWLFPVDKLPKGAKWSDGTKYTSTRTRKKYTFLPIGDDLYIKEGDFIIGVNIRDTVHAKIKNFRSMTVVDVLKGFNYEDIPVMDCVRQFWKDSGLRQGYVVPVLRGW